MRCPYCGSEDTQVKDSRPADDNTSIRRRRICPDCGGRFTTFERVQLRELMVIKKTGRKVPFDRDKLVRSFDVALRKRPVDRDRIERAVSGIVRRLESGQVKLDDAIQSYERGAQLKRHCETKLNEAQQRVDRIVIGSDGVVTVEPAKLG